MALAWVCARGCYKSVTKWGPRCAFSDWRDFAHYTLKLCAKELSKVFYSFVGSSAAWWAGWDFHWHLVTRQSFCWMYGCEEEMDVCCAQVTKHDGLFFCCTCKQLLKQRLRLNFFCVLVLKVFYWIQCGRKEVNVELKKEAEIFWTLFLCPSETTMIL
jgi:hypothetical protein